MQENYFKKKNIFITGITGFIGSCLAIKMRSLGAHVYGLSKSSSTKNNLKANILDFKAVDEFIRDKKIAVCFHLAGESLVEGGQQDPYNTFKTNAEGTLNILESGRKNNVEKIIIASSAHIYGRNKLPYLEGYTPRPSRPYETSKACTDLIAQSYAATFNLPVLIPRFVNIYGPGDLHFERIIPKTIQAVLSDQSPVIWGGDAVRDYLFIDDAINAYVLLAKTRTFSKQSNRIFNFGSGTRISVEDLVGKIIFLSGKTIQVGKSNQEREFEIKLQYVSSNKAIKALGWKPKVSLEEGLRKTIGWYREYFNVYDKTK